MKLHCMETCGILLFCKVYLANYSIHAVKKKN